MPDLAVVHLVWQPLGLGPFNRFVESYRRHTAGIDHTLLILFNGFANSMDQNPYREILDGISHQTISTPAPCMDIPAYLYLSRLVDYKFLCLINSHSEILASHWLAHLYRHGSEPGVGAVGATGCWESLLTNARRELFTAMAKANIVPTDDCLGKHLPASFSGFESFPNPHLRTNALLLRRELLLGAPLQPTDNKMECFQWESGKDGLSHWLRAQKRKLFVISREGTRFETEDWRAARTYRSAEQENLLIGDNRTRDYTVADIGTRRDLSLSAWGQFDGK